MKQRRQIFNSRCRATEPKTTLLSITKSTSFSKVSQLLRAQRLSRSSTHLCCPTSQTAKVSKSSSSGTCPRPGYYNSQSENKPKSCDCLSTSLNTITGPPLVSTTSWAFAQAPSVKSDGSTRRDSAESRPLGARDKQMSLKRLPRCTLLREITCPTSGRRSHLCSTSTVKELTNLFARPVNAERGG